MRQLTLMLAVVIAGIYVSPVCANTVSFTGQLSDWGITGGADGTVIDWGHPSTGILSFVDAHPAYGGAFFKTYAMYVTFDSSNAYIGLAGGFPQDNSGDLALRFNSLPDPHDVVYQYGVRLNTNGWGWGSGDYKGIYSVTSWAVPTVNPSSAPYAIMSYADLLGTANVTYGDNAYSAPHSDPLRLYEVALPLNLRDGATPLNWGGGVNLHWTMDCGNDAINAYNVTPEPASVLLFGIGGIALFLRRRFPKR